MQANSIICTGSARFLNTIYGTCDNSNKLQGYTSDTAKTANTIVRRDGNGYIYDAYYNQSSGAETPTSSSYWMYCNSDGWFRKSSLANLKSQLAVPLDHAITSTGSTISVTASATTAKITYNLENPGVRSATINGNYLRVNTGGTNADLTIPYATSAGNASTVNNLTVQTAVPANAIFTDHTYNFSGTTFYSGNKDNSEHNANNIQYNGLYYYTSNGPATSIGASTADGAIYAQAHSTSWVGQIAQDYRNGNLFTRGKNNGTWQAWRKVAYSDDTYSGTLTSSQVTTALGYTPYNSTNPSGYTSNTGTVTSVTIKASSPISIDSTAAITTSGTRTISHANSGVTAGTYQSVTVNATGHVTAGSALTKAQVTTALGYTPPTSDTNTTYTLGKEDNIDPTARKIKLTPSSGSAQTLTAPYAEYASYLYHSNSGTFGTENLPIYLSANGEPLQCGFHVFTGTVAANSQVDLNLKFGLVIFGRVSTSATPSMMFIDQWGGTKSYYSNTTHVISVVAAGTTVRVKNNGSTVANYVAIGSTA